MIRSLSQALQVLAAHPRLPASCLVDKLVDQVPALPVITAQAEGQKNPAEFWTALSNKLRPSLTLTVTFVMPVGKPEQAPLAVASEIIRRSDGATHSDGFRVGGRVTDGAKAALVGANVRLPAKGRMTSTDNDGRYSLGSLAAGSYTLQFSSGGRSQDLKVTVPPKSPTEYDLQLS